MDIHDEFTRWASNQGVQINGIAAHRFPGKGLGIIAQKRFKAGETLLTVPVSALRTVRTVPRSIAKPIGKITVHGLLAAELTTDTSSTRAAWRAVLPTKTDFEESMPLMWPEVLQGYIAMLLNHIERLLQHSRPSNTDFEFVRFQDLLPAAAKKLLVNQKSKFNADWASVSTAFPEISKEEYLYRWLIVNTRTFYYLSSNVKRTSPRDDCMALNPFADYFNHTDDEGLEVLFSDNGYTISTNQAIEKGKEVNISYGAHSNDFLLAEYGFILEENKWDEVSLDDYILPRLSSKQQGLLRDANFLGNYTLDKNGVCYRTQVALRLLCLPLTTWKRVIANGLDDGGNEQVLVDKMLMTILESHRKEALSELQKLGQIQEGQKCQRETLISRWKQVLVLLQAAKDRIPEMK